MWVFTIMTTRGAPHALLEFEVHLPLPAKGLAQVEAAAARGEVLGRAAVQALVTPSDAHAAAVVAWLEGAGVAENALRADGGRGEGDVFFFFFFFFFFLFVYIDNFCSPCQNTFHWIHCMPNRRPAPTVARGTRTRR
jgi:hypothetical protein